MLKMKKGYKIKCNSYTAASREPAIQNKAKPGLTGAQRRVAPD